jgi:uncharacterized protein (TIGR02145 family)
MNSQCYKMITLSLITVTALSLNACSEEKEDSSKNTEVESEESHIDSHLDPIDPHLDPIDLRVESEENHIDSPLDPIESEHFDPFGTKNPIENDIADENISLDPVVEVENLDTNPKLLALRTDYIAFDSLSVKMNSITTEEKTGSYVHTINYTLTNNTIDEVIEEGSFKAFYENKAGGLAQYGFFGKLFPGDTKSNSYSFETLKSDAFKTISYGDLFSANKPLSTDLVWSINPIEEEFSEEVVVEEEITQDPITHNGFSYLPVISPLTSRVWLDKNLGATQVCQSYEDELCYGDYYQWGRATDGHEKVGSTAFTIGLSDWRSDDENGTKRVFFLNKIDGSGVCPVGYRVPSIREMESEEIYDRFKNSTNTFNFLKIPRAGYRGSLFGSLIDVGISSNISALDISSEPAIAYPIRCLKHINRAPTAKAQSLLSFVGTTNDTIELGGSDLDGDTLRYTIVSNPTHGTLTGTAPHVNYSANSNYEGADSFTFSVNDGEVNSSIATIDITVFLQKTITHKGLTYKPVISPYTNKIWLDRNLGATQVCQSFDDTACYGDYYQWGRDADGHEKRDSGSFITGADDWTEVDNDGSQRSAFWSKTDGSSICPIGYRVPSTYELSKETLYNGLDNRADAFNNFLKLPSAGHRNYYDVGSLNGEGSYGYVWTATPSSSSAHYLYFNSDHAHAYYNSRAYGCSVRCLKD